MWILKRISDQENDLLQFYLLPGRQYVVGRKDCDIVIPGDSTISRKHAVISVEKEKKEGDYCIHINDTSKTGVFLNGAKITGNTNVSVKKDDVVSFGKLQIKLKFNSYHIRVITSGISKSSQKTRIKNSIQKLGGTICSEWSPDITHLIMDKLIFTMKVVFALACGKSIVTSKFFDDILDCVDQKKGNTMPVAKDYLPTVAEQTMLGQESLFLPNGTRNILLAGKVFIIFTEKQYKRVKEAVEYAGGSAQFEEKKDKRLLKKITASTQLIFVQVDNKELKDLQEETKAWIREVQEKLERHKLRAVGESEIGLAILYVSLERYCNPAISEVPTLCRTTNTQSVSCTQSSQSQFQSGSYSALRKNLIGNQPEVNSKEDAEEDQRKRKRLDSEKGSKSQQKKMKLGETILSKNDQKSKDKNQNVKVESWYKTDPKNITEIDDFDDDDFQFDETALSVVRSTTNPDHSKRPVSQNEPQNTISGLDDTRKTKNNKRSVSVSMCDDKNTQQTQLTSIKSKPENVSSSTGKFVQTRNTRSQGREHEENTKKNDVKSPDKQTMVVPNTEFVSDAEKTSNVTQLTSISKKAIPETAMNITTDMLDDDFDDLDNDDVAEENPFEFDILDCSGSNVKKASVTQSGRRTSSDSQKQQNPTQEDEKILQENTEEEKEDEKPTSRFLKAMASSQDSDSGDILVLNSQGSLVPCNTTRNGHSDEDKINETVFSNGKIEKQSIGPSPKLGKPLKKPKIEEDSFSSGWRKTGNGGAALNNDTSSDTIKGNSDSSKSTKSTNVTIATDKNKSRKQSDADDLSYMLDDDALVSDEFPPAATKITMSIDDGWLTTAMKRSDSMIPKLDPDLEDLPRDLMQTEFHSLVVKVTLQNQKKENYTECNTNLKNTKCFRKQIYAGRTRRNVVIKSSDLTIFKSCDEEKGNMFDTFREEYDREEEEERRITQMFNKVAR